MADEVLEDLGLRLTKVCKELYVLRGESAGILAKLQGVDGRIEGLEVEQGRLEGDILKHLCERELVEEKVTPPVIAPKPAVVAPAPIKKVEEKKEEVRSPWLNPKDQGKPHRV